MPVTHGRHWSYDHPVLEIFGAKGQLHEGRAYLGHHDYALVATKVLDVKESIQGRIMSLGYGQANARLHHIGLDEFRALHLFFEGILTVEALAAAEEDDVSITVLLPMGSKTWPFVIRTYPPMPVMYHTAEGKVI